MSRSFSKLMGASSIACADPEAQLGGAVEATEEAREKEPLPPRIPKRGRFLTNLSANMLGFGTQTAIVLLLTPYLIRHLGWAAYGLIPLTNVVVSYAGLITSSLNFAVNRFITVEIEQGNVTAANRFFNTSLFTNAAVVSALVLPGIIAGYHVGSFLRVPAGYEVQARWLFLGSMTLFLLTTLTASFDAATFCRNRFDVKKLVTITAQITGRVLLVVALFSLISPNLSIVGLGLAVTGALTLAGAIIAWHYLLPEVTISWEAFHWPTFCRLMGPAFWTIINQMGTLLLVGVDLILVNRMFGAEKGGQYAAVAQWSVYFRGFAMMFASTFGPTMIALYARRQQQDLIRYTRMAVKSLGIVLAAMVGVICGLAAPFLRVWLGDTEAESLAPLLVLLLLPLSVNLAYLPLNNISIATNNFRLPGMVQLMAGFVNLGLAILLGGTLGLGVTGVAVAGVTVLTVRNLVFTPLYASYLIGRPWWTFLREVLPCSLLTVGLFTIGRTLSGTALIDSALQLTAAGAFLLLISIPPVWFTLLSAAERQLFCQVFRIRPLQP